MTIQQVLLMSVSFTKWNSSDKDANIVLSDNDLTAETDGTTCTGAARAIHGKSGGKWYYEVNIVAEPGGVVVGVGKSTMSLADSPGLSDADGWGWSGATKFNFDGGISYGSGFSAGTVVGVAVDMSGGNLTFYKDGVSQGVAYSNLSGTIYPAIGLQGTNGLPVSEITANFGASTFAYAPPSGYAAWTT